MNSVDVHRDLAEISNGFGAILLDAYGVFWGGNDVGLLPRAKEMMEALVSQGKVVGILSNSTQLAAKELYKLSQHSLIQGKHFHFLITSGEVTRELFLSHQLPFDTSNKKFWVLYGDHPRFSSHSSIFQGTTYVETPHIDEADFVYIGVPHIGGEDQTDPELFHEQVQQLKKENLILVCANPDRFAHEGKPARAVVRQGTIAALYEALGGTVHYIGKPYEAAYSHAMRHFHKENIFDPKEILMVGDTPETDIRGARQFGMASALITQTGIMGDRIAQQGFEQAISTLSPKNTPNFFIERFAHACL